MPLRKIQSDMVSNLADLDFNTATLYSNLSVYGEIRTTNLNWITAADVNVSSLTTRNNLQVSGNLTIAGNLSALGTTTYLDTQVVVTSAMSITNVGTGPALLVNQTGPQPIANFQDDGTAVLFVADGGNVGIKTITPQTALDIVGNTTISGNVSSFGSGQDYFQGLILVRQSSTIKDGIQISPADIGSDSRNVTITTPGAPLGANRTLTLADADTTLTAGTMAATGTAQTFTAAQTFRAANAIRSEAASTQDAIVLAGRAGGNSSFATTLTPATLGGNRILTLPDVTGTLATLAGTETFTNKTLTAPVISSITNGAATLTLPTAAGTFTLATLAGTETFTNKIVRRPINTQTTNYILAAGDAGKIIVTTNVITITLNTSIFTAGDTFIIINNDSNNKTIIAGSSVTICISGSAITSSSSYVLPANRSLYVVCVAASKFFGILG